MTPEASDLMVRREAGVALWKQIAATLQERIAAGSYPPGGQLPTEQQLSRSFAVNRHTVRRALEELSRGGLIRIEQGRGSFVAEDVIDYIVATRTRFSEWVRRQNKEPSGRVLRLTETAAPAAVATGLGLRIGARVIVMERLGFADDRPVCLTSHWFSSARFGGLLAALREAPTITEALRRVGVADYQRQVTRVTARLPTPEEANRLQTVRSRPLLSTENINIDRDGAVVEFCTALYPTPRVQIVFEP